MKTLLKVKLLVESTVNHGFNDDEDNNEPDKRALYRPEYIDAYLVKAHIMEFHPNRQYPYETLVTMSDGDVYSINVEFEEFAKLYEQ